MKNIQSILFLFLVLVSGYSRGQCTGSVRFSSTAPPTITAFPGIPQRACIQQCTTGTCTSVNIWATIPSGTFTTGSGSWQVLGTGLTLTGIVNTGVQSVIATLAPGVTDLGKLRLVFRYQVTGSTCGCIDTLDLFRQMITQTSPFFAPIQGLTCLTPGVKSTFYVDPRFTRPANLGLGIGVDNYLWTATGTNIGTWTIGPAGGNIASGDNSLVEITPATSATWTSSTASVNVVQGNTCNTWPVPLAVSKGVEPTNIRLEFVSGTLGLDTIGSWASNSVCLQADKGLPQVAIADQGHLILRGFPRNGVSYKWGQVQSTYDVVDTTTGTSVLPFSTYETHRKIRLRAKAGTSGSVGVFSLITTPLSGFCGAQGVSTYTVNRRLVASYNNIVCTGSTGSTCPASGDCIIAGPGVTYTLGINNLPSGVLINWNLNAAGSGQNWTATFTNPVSTITVTAPPSGANPDLISITTGNCSPTTAINRQFTFPGAPTFPVVLYQLVPTGSRGTAGRQTFGVSNSGTAGDWPPTNCSDGLTTPIDPKCAWRFVGRYKNADSVITDYPGTGDTSGINCLTGTGGTNLTAVASPTIAAEKLRVFLSTIGVNSPTVRLRAGRYLPLTPLPMNSVRGPYLFLRLTRSSSPILSVDSCNGGTCLDCEYHILMNQANGQAYRQAVSGDDDEAEIIPKESKTFKVFPNPTNGKVEVQIKQKIETDVELMVTTIDGRIIETKILSKGQKSISINFEKSGTYYLLPKDSRLEPVSVIVNK